MTGTIPLFDRRDFLAGASALTAGLTLPGAANAAFTPTPRQPRGPFYPDILPADQDADLIRVAGHGEAAEGEVLHLIGRVLDQSGRPVPGALVEIWQCDARGRYIHSRDAARGRGDPNFQGYGRTEAKEGGAYAFRTIRPVPYGSRTPHIHFAVRRRSFGELVTQMYVAGEPRNDVDFLYTAIRDPAARRAVTVDLRPAHALDAWTGTFDIVLAG